MIKTLNALYNISEVNIFAKVFERPGLFEKSD